MQLKSFSSSSFFPECEIYRQRDRRNEPVESDRVGAGSRITESTAKSRRIAGISKEINFGQSLQAILASCLSSRAATANRRAG
jgi:hypothetical protein